MRKKKKVNIEKIAQLAGVSTATVSRVINNKSNVSDRTKSKVNEILQAENYAQMNYSTEEKNNSKKSNTIVIFMPDFSNPFNDNVIEGIRKSANSHGYTICLVLTKVTNIDIAHYNNILKDISVAGIISLAAIPNNDVAEELKKRWPIVMCSEYSIDADISFVGIDNVLAAKQGTTFLVNSGRSDVALVNASTDHRYALERQKGYSQALAAQGIEKKNDLIINLSTMNYQIAFSEIKFLLINNPNINAIFATSDLFAAAAIAAAKEIGKRVPEDISIVGFDNISIASMISPTITTISQPADDIGYESCEILIEHINKPDTKPKYVILPTEFIIRESTSLIYSV